MSGYLANLHSTYFYPQSSTYTSVTSAADVLWFHPGRPVQIIRWGIIATTAVADATNGLKLTGDLRPTAGSNTNRVTGASNTSTLVDTAGGSLSVPAATTQIAAGKGAYHNVQSPGAPALEAAVTEFVVWPGQEFVIAVQATAPAAGAGYFFVEYKELPLVGDSKLVSTGVVSGNTPSVSNYNLTQYSS